MTDIEKLKLKLENAKRAYRRAHAKNRFTRKHNNDALMIDDITSVFTKAEDNNEIGDVCEIFFMQKAVVR